jgi:hypothetical protein
MYLWVSCLASEMTSAENPPVLPPKGEETGQTLERNESKKLHP